MSEADAVARAQDGPVTISSLTADLRALGVAEGMTLLAHASLSALGWVCGGPQAVIAALRAALGKAGTLMMPAHSADRSNPAHWQDPPVPESWWPVIRAEMPAWNAALTPTRGMGAIAETFRKMKNVVRSNHPRVSFCALGPKALELTVGQRLADGLGERSPLARLYEADGHVLLLGCGHASNTSLHLSETRAEYPGKRTYEEGAAVETEDGRAWKTWDELYTDASDFEKIGAAFGGAQKGGVGAAEAHLMRQRELVDFGVEWMSEHR